MAATNKTITASTVEDKLLIASDGSFYTVYENSDDDLVVAHSDDGGDSWTEVVLTGSFANIHSAAIDSQDIIHVIYKRTNYIVGYRQFSGGSWGSEEEVFDGTSDTDVVEQFRCSSCCLESKYASRHS